MAAIFNMDRAMAFGARLVSVLNQLLASHSAGDLPQLRTRLTIHKIEWASSDLPSRSRYKRVTPWVKC